MTTAYHRDFDRLCSLLKERRQIAFSMRLAQITGHPKDAVLLSQLVYWTRHGRDVVASKGWIHKTRTQWFEETGLSREEQESVRQRLRRLDLVQEWRGGRPARLYFRIHTGALSVALSHSHRLQQTVNLSLDFMRGNEHAMRALFGPTVAFHRVLAEVTGSVNAALMLSRMIQLQRRTLDTNAQWFSLTASEWARDCGLKRRQFENAKHKLKQLGLIEEFTSNERCRRVFSRVHPERLLELLSPILRKLSSCADVMMRVSGSGPIAASRNAAIIVQTLDTQNGSKSISVHKGGCDSVQTLDRQHCAQPFSVRDARHSFIRALDTKSCDASIAAHARVNAQKSLTNLSCAAKLDGEKRALQLAGFVHGSRRETYIANARAYKTTGTNTPTTTGVPGGTTAFAPLIHNGLSSDVEPGVVVGQESAVPERKCSQLSNERSRGLNAVEAFESRERPEQSTVDMYGLIWPSWVHAAEQQLIVRHLTRVPQTDRQIMLDEMAASHRQHPVQWPVAYVGTLVKRYQAGDFVPAKAHLERECRRLAAVRQVELREREELFASQLSSVSSSETARRNLAALRDELRRQCGKSGGKRD